MSRRVESVCRQERRVVTILLLAVLLCAVLLFVCAAPEPTTWRPDATESQ